jgi:predicted O-methyltransferase YrrM
MVYFPQLRVVKMTSEQASTMFPDGYFDMVFIDGDHSYEMAKNDILRWKALLREDGLLTGHDYSSKYEGVVKAVNEVLGKDNITILSGSIWTCRVIDGSTS